MRGRRFFISVLWEIRALGLFLLLFFTCPSSRAGEICYPVPSYEGEALKEVRQ